MIGVNGQYLLNFSIADKKDFILEADLNNFTLIEDAGNCLPSYALSFNTTDDSILHYLNERNTLFVSYGMDTNSLITSKLSISSLQTSRMGNDKREITITGFYSAPSYMGDSKLYISPSMSGVALIQQIASTYFKVESNITKSNDSQRWIQYNITDRKFIHDVWPRCHVPNSFIAMGITSSGKFILKDIKKSFNEKPKWKLGMVPARKSDEIMTDSNAQVTFNSGYINNWKGYEQEMLTYSLEDDIADFHIESADIGMANTKNRAKNLEINKRFTSTTLLTDNTHSEYQSAYQRNLSYLSRYSAFKVGLTYSSIFHPIQVLDLVTYNEDALGSSNHSASYHTGLFLVSKVSRTIAGRNIRTLLHLVRESSNQVK